MSYWRWLKMERKKINIYEVAGKIGKGARKSVPLVIAFVIGNVLAKKDKNK